MNNDNYCIVINVKHKTCIHPNCKIRPSFNDPDKKEGLYCNQHKKDGMIDVISKTCKSEWCFTRVCNNKYDNYCLYCYINLFPDKQVSRNYKTKEYSIQEFIKNKFPQYDWINDKKIENGCSKRRPDILLDLGYQIIIIEIDENQHKNYDCSCENKRIMELSQDLQFRPIIFIRFNPDEYKINEKNIKSCWKINKNGICVIKKDKIKDWEERLESLSNIINYWTNPINKTNKTVEIIELFYNQ